MSHLMNITKKELKEILTPGAVMSIVVVMLMMCCIGVLINGEVSDASKLSSIGIVNGDEEGEYSDLAIEYIKEVYINNGVDGADIDKYVVILDAEYGDNNAIIAEVQEKGLSSAIAFDPDFSEDITAGIAGTIEKYYVYNNGGIFSTTTSAVNEVLIGYVNTYFSNLLIEANVDNPDYSSEFLLNPIDQSVDLTDINGTVYEGITPYQISTTLMGQTMMIPLIIMIIIIMIGSIVISSMGNEKENKTLETLLTLPIKRTTIVAGKLLASALVGLIYGLAYMVGMMFYMGSITSGISGVNLADYGLSLDITDWVMLGIMVFLSIMAALGMCMILGAFVKNYKAAQTMTMPISVLAMIPMFVIMFVGWGKLPIIGQIILFIIPFTHPMMAMNNLMFGDMTLVLGGIAYLIIFSLAMIAVTVKIYNSDVLLTGLAQTKTVRTFKKIFGGKKHAE